MLEHVAGRVPVIVTTTHFSTPHLRRAQPPRAGCGRRHGHDHAALSRRDHPRAANPGSSSSSSAVSDAIGIPIMIQDAPVAGTPLSAPFLARMAREIEQRRYFKIEMPQAAAKLRELIGLGGDADRRPLGRRGRRSPCWPTSMPARPAR